MNEEQNISENQPVPETAEPVKAQKEEGVKFMTQPEYDKALLKQSMPMAFIAGLIVAVACAAAWAWLTLSTGNWYVYMGVFVGVVVGLTVRVTGRAVQSKFGILAAILALFGCALGNFLWAVGYIAESGSLEHYLNVLSNFDISRIAQIMKESFAPLDILFYVLAPIAGFVTGFQNVKITQ